MAKRKKGYDLNLMNPLNLLILFIFFAGFALYLYNHTLKVQAGADKTGPQIQFVSPTEGTVIGDGIVRLNSVQIDANITDDSNVHRAYLYVDDVNVAGFTKYIGGSFTNEGPQRAYWANIKEFENGEHTMTIEATDYRKNTTRKSITFELNNGPKTDTTPPIINITYPTEGMTVKRNSTVRLQGTVTDSGGSGLAKHYTEVVGHTNWTDTSCEGYGAEQMWCSFRAQGKSGTPITIKTTAWDYEGNTSENLINITVE